LGTTPENKNSEDSFFLPDFCSVRMVFVVVIIGELLAFILVLSPFNYSVDRWGDLSIISLFIQWVALSTAAALCITRRFLQKLEEKIAATLSYLISLLVTLFLSEVAFWIMQNFNFNVSIVPGWHIHLLLQNMMISAIVNAVALRYFYVQHQWKRQIVAESQSRIQALQARIRPHFLFNSLNTIASLTRVQPELAEEAIEDLADLFRQSLADSRQQITIAEELELTRRYLSIEKLRMGDRLDVIWDIDKLPEDALIPALSIQPLMENAIYHGVEPLANGGIITISGNKTADELISITLTNPLPDTPEIRHGNKMALKNIKSRLEAFHGHKGKIAFENKNNSYTINITFPYLTSEKEKEQ
jgi:two-component system sensor histidine kinase AlgZ